MKKPVTRIALLLDESSSMHSLKKEAVDAFNVTANVIREKTSATDQDNSVTLIKFSSSVTEMFYNADARTLKNLDYGQYHPNGCTVFFDAIKHVIDKFRSLPDANDENVSFLVLAVTDGEEYLSMTSAETIQRLLRETQQTGRWSFVFQVPPGYGAKLAKNFGIPVDNIREWDTSAKGMKEVQVSNADAVGNYLDLRSQNVRSVTNFYRMETDLSKVSDKKIKTTLTDISANFRSINVDKEAVVKEFIEEKTKKPYILGSAYYLLCKKENIQKDKRILIQKKGEKAIYGGVEARRILGLPDDGTAKVTPLNHKDYDVFVQSTSINRKLPRGTRVLWDKTQVTNLAPTWDHTILDNKS